jgi:hypothetical protein
LWTVWMDFLKDWWTTLNLWLCPTTCKNMATYSSTDTPSLSETRPLSVKVLTNPKKGSSLHPNHRNTLWISRMIYHFQCSVSVLLIFIPNQGQSYRIRQGVSGSGVFLFSLVDTKETITTVNVAAFLHSM